MLNIIETLNKPTVTEVAPPAAAAAEVEQIKEEIISETAAAAPAAPSPAPAPAPLTAADIKLNTMFARSMVEGADELNSWGCKEVSGEEKKEIFQAAESNKNELAQFIVLVMEKNGGRVPLWLYGIWLTGKTFAPPWLLVIKLRGKNKLINKLTKEAEQQKHSAEEELKKKEEEIQRLKTDLEATQKINVEQKSDLIPVNKQDHLKSIEKNLEQAEIPPIPGEKLKDGTVYAPYGYKADGTPRRSAGGRKSKSIS